MLFWLIILAVILVFGLAGLRAIAVVFLLVLALGAGAFGLMVLSILLH